MQAYIWANSFTKSVFSFAKIGKPLCVLLFFCGLFLFSSCSNDGWKDFDSAEYTVRFPGIARDTATIEGQTGGIRVFYEPGFESIDENVYYAVSVYSLPEAIDSLNNLKEALTTDAKIYAWSMGGEIGGEGKAVKSGDVQGYEFKVLMPSNTGVVTLRKFALGKRLFTLLVITDNVNLNNASIGKFMDSFVLKKPVPNSVKK
ncbi:MAG: hypothetical protein ACRCYO_15090 [Bacteroidia bacterium]